MSLFNRCIKAVALVIALNVSLCVAQSSQAQFTLSMIAGGSSSLLGDFRPDTYRSGALPQGIEKFGVIANYKTSSLQSDNSNIMVVTSQDSDLTNPNNLLVKDRNGILEVVSDAEIRYIKISNSQANIIVLLRSDSGLGVRYISNESRIVQWPQSTGTATVGNGVLQKWGFRKVKPIPLSFADIQVGNNRVTSSAGSNLTQADINVLNSLLTQVPQPPTGTSGIGIDTGFSDVAADTVIRYVGVPLLDIAHLQEINVAGKLYSQRLAVMTLLLLYNKNIHTASGTNYPINFSRAQVRSLVSGAAGDRDLTRGLYWSQVDPRLKQSGTGSEIPISTAYRENTSGSRITELLNIQRYNFTNSLTENGIGFNVSPTTIGATGVNPNPQTGTGNMTTTVNKGVGSPVTKGVVFGYSYITGAVSSSLTDIRVGLFNGVAPYKRSYPSGGGGFADTGGTAISLPSLNGQPSYGIVAADPNAPNYYTEAANGRYELWTYPIQLTNTSVRNTAAATDLSNGIQNVLDDPSTIQIINSLGLTLISQMQVGRASYLSEVTGEAVTDGLFITYGPDSYSSAILN